jgi:hypothetical protein
VSWCIDDVDPVIAPETSGRSRRDRDPALLLLLHPVHGSRTVMHFTDLVGFTGVEQNALCGRGFTGINVCHDADIAIHTEWMAACHGLYSVQRGCVLRRPIGKGAGFGQPL